jgi:ectoine hydroxylase-related dioxygenase (phytanoyl-CoA dioxygenase family)
LNQVLAKGPLGFDDDEPKPLLFRDLANLDGDTPTGDVSAAPVWQITNIWEAAPAFKQLLHHPFIVEAIRQLTDFDDLQVWHDQVQYKPAGIGGATGWHQDAPLWPSIEPMTEVSAWVPFDDAGIDNGCMWMVPGSHRWGNHIDFLVTQSHLMEQAEFDQLESFTPPPDATVQDVRPRPCPVQRGQVHFHHGLTWHGSPRNHSTRPRRAVAIHYMSSNATFTGGDHLMKQFIEVGIGEPMRNAGDRFPVVCRDGQKT